MMPAEAAAAGAVILTSPASRGSSFQGSWISVAEYEGTLLIEQMCGSVTGSITTKIRDADDSSGTNAADVSGATFTIVSGGTSNIAKLVIDASAVRPYIQVDSTIVTGPALHCVTLTARRKVV